jgi:hypothetical protein
MRFLLCLLVIGIASAQLAELETFATFGWGNQPTGVAVSSDHRVFVNFPR